MFACADEMLDRGDVVAAAELIDGYVDALAADRPPEPNEHSSGDSEAFVRKLAAAEDLVRNETRERLLVLNRGGQVSLYLRGSASQVFLPTNRDGSADTDVLNQLTGAYCLTHNHPVGAGRPVGGTLSLSDILTAQRFEVQRVRVAAREATYSLEPRDQVRWDASWAPATAKVYRTYQTSLDRAMEAAPGAPSRDIFFYLRVFDFLMVQLAKRFHLRYTRIDQPRAEWAREVPSPRTRVIESDGQTVIDDGEHFRWMSSVIPKTPLRWE